MESMIPGTEAQKGRKELYYDNISNGQFSHLIYILYNPEYPIGRNKYYQQNLNSHI